MSKSTLQTLDSIGPLGGGKADAPKDPVAKEYEEGKRFLDQREYSQAAVALHNALVGYEERGDDNGIANASNQLGHACLGRQEFAGALKNYERALAICTKANDRMSILAVSIKIVAAQKGLKQYDKAIATCLDMLDHYQDNRDPQGTVTTLEEMAEIYIISGQLEKAADAYRTVASIHKNFRHDNIAEGYLKKAAELAAGNS